MAKRARGEQTEMFDASGVAPASERKERKVRRAVRLGRRPRADRIGFVSHAVREEHDSDHPVHVSMRCVPRAPSLRHELIFRAILGQLARVKRLGVRVVHYSVQHNHLHLIVEGRHRQDLSAQMRKLFSRVALVVNAIAKRRGRLFRDRHHPKSSTAQRKSVTPSSTCSSTTESTTRRTAARSRRRCCASSTTAAPPRGSKAGTREPGLRRRRSRGSVLATTTSMASAQRSRNRKRGSRNAAGACAAAAGRSSSTSFLASWLGA